VLAGGTVLAAIAVAIIAVSNFDKARPRAPSTPYPAPSLI